MKLIVNADDYGLSKGVSLGILDCMERGIVTETTAMVNGLYFNEAMEDAKKRGIKNIGIHLTLTWGKPTLPCEEVQSLINEKGYFYKIGQIKEYNYDEIKKELKAQIEKFLKSGVKPTHLDGHHHFYGFDKKILDIVLNLGKEYNLPIRLLGTEMYEYYKLKGIKTTEAFTSDFYLENVNLEKLKEIILKYKKFNVLEIMSHPAYVDEDLINATSYNTHRNGELEILTSKEIKQFINYSKIELVCYNQILDK